MKKRTTFTIIASAAALIVIGLLLFSGGAQASIAGDATVYKDPNCGCCGGYADFLSRQGAQVTIEQGDASAVKDEHGIPHDMRSCHTTVMDGYVIEGHVPGYAVQKLLEERPDIAGIALPGMPTGVPGMPGPHEHATIYALHHDGSTSEYMQI